MPGVLASNLCSISVSSVANYSSRPANMTINATCPKGHTLTLEEKLAGKKIRCPRCQVVFEVPYPDDDVEEAEAISEKPIRKAARRRDDDDDDDEDDDDRPRRKARPAAARSDDDDDDDEDGPEDYEARRKAEKKLKKKQLKLVDVGLLLHYIKLCMYIVGILLLMTIATLIAISGAQAVEAVEAAPKGQAPAVGGVAGFQLMGFAILVLLYFVVNLVISLLAPLVGVVGSFLCCFAPKKSEVRGTLIISLTFDLISLIAWLLNVLAITGVFGMEAHKTENMVFLLQMITFICMVTSWLTFLTSMRSLGKYLGEPGLGNEALNLIARLVVQVVTLILDFMIIVMFGRYFVGVFLAIMLAIGFMTIWFVLFIFTFYLRQLKLVGAMRLAVQNKL